MVDRVDPKNDPNNLLERAAYSVTQFCARNGISRPHYYKMKRENRGPREMYIGYAVRISAEAERDWQHAQENPTGAAAVDRARAQQSLRERATANAPRAA